MCATGAGVCAQRCWLVSTASLQMPRLFAVRLCAWGPYPLRHQIPVMLPAVFPSHCVSICGLVRRSRTVWRRATGLVCVTHPTWLPPRCRSTSRSSRSPTKLAGRLTRTQHLLQGSSLVLSSLGCLYVSMWDGCSLLGQIVDGHITEIEVNSSGKLFNNPVAQVACRVGLGCTFHVHVLAASNHAASCRLFAPHHGGTPCRS